MKVIFLDVDGVLNTTYSKSRCGEYIGVDSSKVKKLREIVDATGAELVLSSTWRLGYNRDHQQLEGHVKYLHNKLGKQHLHTVGYTPDLGYGGNHRGQEIMAWLKKNDDVVTEWVVLDDEIFTDFHSYGIIPHLVQTDFWTKDGGLQDEHVQKAIAILNGGANEKEAERKEGN